MKQRKYLLILIGLLGMIQIHAQKSVAFKTDDESPLPQWIGAITDEDAHIPSNRDYVGTGTVNAKGKPDWKATAPLSRQSIWLKKEMKLPADVRKATMKIVGLGFYELSINRQKVDGCRFRPSVERLRQDRLLQYLRCDCVVEERQEPTFGIAGERIL